MLPVITSNYQYIERFLLWVSVIMLIDERNPGIEPMRINVGQIDLSDDVEQLLKVGAELKGISLRAYVSTVVDGFMKRHKKAILQTVKHKAAMYGIEPGETMERLYTGQGFQDLKIVNHTPFDFDNLDDDNETFFKPGIDDACIDCDLNQETK